MRERRQISNNEVAAVASGLLVGVGLRLFNLGATGFWFDEVYTANLVTFRTTPDYIISFVAENDSHPPFSYLLAWFWAHLTGIYGSAFPQVAPGTEVKLRLLSVVLGIGVVYLTYLLGRRLFSPKVGIVAGWLAAVSPLLIRQDREARMYPLLTFLSLLGFFLLDRALEKNRRRDWLIYGLIAVILLYTHYLSFFILFGQALYLVIRMRELKPQWRFLWSVTPLLLYLPWVAVLLQSIGNGGAYEAFRPSVEAVSTFAIDSLITYNFQTDFPFARLIASILAWGLVAIGWYSLWTAKNNLRLWILVSQTFCVYLVWYLTSEMWLNTMSTRYLGFLHPWFYLAMALGLTTMWQKKIRVGTGAWAFTVAWFMLAGTYGVYTAPSETWRDFATVLDEVVEPGDLVLANETGRLVSIVYYFRPAEGVAIRQLNVEKLADYQQYDRIWLVFRSFGPLGLLLDDTSLSTLNTWVKSFNTHRTIMIDSDAGITVTYLKANNVMEASE